MFGIIQFGKLEYYPEVRAICEGNMCRNYGVSDMDSILEEFAVCMKNGSAPGTEESQSLVKKLQNHITENYYTCNRKILSGLGQMYVADERFKNNIDKHADGTGEFISEAIAIYSQKQ